LAEAVQNIQNFAEGSLAMRIFQVLLAVMFAVLLVYTGLVVGEHGLGLFSVFFGDIAKMGWPGQFNLDFLGFLILSAVWLAWRHRFSGIGFVLAVCGFFGGIGFLAPYLLVASFKAKGDPAELLLGPSRI
jgi:hypothetical protein